MPEGDSIHRLARRLDARLRGIVITASELRTAAYATTDLTGFVFREVRAVGKHLLMRIDGAGRELTVHSAIRMDGEWTVIGADKHLPSKLDHDVRVQLNLSDGSTLVGLRLPVLDVVETADEASVVEYLGPDLLGEFDMARALLNFSATPSAPVIQALLDQRNVSGIGNLWAVETCFLRGMFPWKPVAEVDIEPALLLAQKMMRYSLDKVPGMITTGVRKRGQTHWVYGRYKKPCLRCRTPVRFRPHGPGPYDRDTWWCPSCQPE